MTSVANVADFRVSLDGKDLSDRLRPRLISLRLSEKRGGDADELEIAITDHDGRMAIPAPGATLTVQLGWKAGSDVAVGLVDKGKFVVDAIEHSGPPDVIVIRARSADMTSAIRTRRDHSWHKTTLGAILAQVAARNKLSAHCAPSLASHQVDALTQSRESDMALLRRLGREHDATATIKAGTLIFTPIGAATTASGQKVPGLTIRRGDGDRHTFRIEKREEAGEVEAHWHDRKAAKKKTVKVGSGSGPTRRLARAYGSEAAAHKAASAESSRAGRAPRKLDLGLALGRLEIYPDRPVIASGFKAEIDAIRWLVADVTHELLPDRGFTSSVTLESAA
ncbi:contractile injection system protein, VgrG/Pvc8 family [Sphingomonas sp. LB2R24]|uniref:contractile injection system protein, VgrG/Pvc8 family n=1 Tax=Sphingomonas sorbitolis TaxID=3096165 RepID=UPI002FC8464D